MRVLELIWDDWNEAHIARHGVGRDEVAVTRPDAQLRRHRLEERSLGPDGDGRQPVLAMRRGRHRAAARAKPSSKRRTRPIPSSTTGKPS